MSDVVAIDVTLSPSVSSVDVVVYDVGSTASVALVADVPPVNAIPGMLWWDSTGTGLYINYDDSTSVQWVSAQNPYTLGDAPNDSNTYGRHAGAWINLAGGTGIGGPFLPLSGGSASPMAGHLYMANHSMLDVAGINSYGYAPLPFANAIQTAGYQFWPPGGGYNFTSGPLKPYFDINTSLTGTIDDASQTVVAANRLVYSRDTVAAPMTRGLAWLAAYGNIGYPFVWQPTHAYAVNDIIAWHGRIYQATTAGTSAASGGPTGTGSAITDGSVVWAYQSPNNTGDRTGLYSLLTVTSEAGDVAAGRAGGPVFVAVGGSVQCNFTQGGTDLVNNAAGGVWACNFLANLGSGATNIGALVGAEISIEAAAGSSVKNKVGCQVVITSNDTVAATNGQEIGYFLANQTTQGVSSGWMTGLAFGDAVNGFFPLRATGTLIKAGSQGGTINAANGIDFSAVTFSGYSILMPNFYVTGTGAMRIGGATQNELSIIPGANSTADIAFQQSGTGQFQFDGNIITTGWFMAPGDSSRVGLGTTNTLYLQGGTQPEIEVVGNAKMFFQATGGFQFNGPFGIGVAPIAKPTVSGAKGGNAALASLMTALAAYGLVIDSTTA